MNVAFHRRIQQLKNVILTPLRTHEKHTGTQTTSVGQVSKSSHYCRSHTQCLLNRRFGEREGGRGREVERNTKIEIDGQKERARERKLKWIWKEGVKRNYINEIWQKLHNIFYTNSSVTFIFYGSTTSGIRIRWQGQSGKYYWPISQGLDCWWEYLLIELHSCYNEDKVVSYRVIILQSCYWWIGNTCDAFVLLSSIKI